MADQQATDKDFNHNLGLGNAHFNHGNFEKAIHYHKLALDIAKIVRNKAGEGQVYNNLSIDFGGLGDFKESKRYIQMSLDIAKEEGDRVGQAMAYCSLGEINRRLSDVNQAIECLNKSLDIFKELGDKAGEGHCYCNLGNCYHNLADFEQAFEFQNQALKIARELGNKLLIAKTLNNLGNILHKLSNFKKAIEYYNQALAINKGLRSRAAEGRCYCNIGNAYLELGEFKRALNYFKQHLLIATEVGDKAGEGGAYGNLGIVCHKLGDVKKAIDYQNQHLSIAKEVGSKHGEGRAYGNLASAYVSLANFEKALEYQKEDLSIAEEVGDRAQMGRANLNLGIVFFQTSDYENAIKHHRECLSIAQELGDRAGEGLACCNLGNAYLCLGDFKQAIEYYTLHLGIAKEQGNRAGEGSCYGNLGNAAYHEGNFSRANDYLRKFLSVAKETDDMAEQGRAYYLLGCVFEASGSFCHARDYYRSSVNTYDNMRNLLQSEDQWKISFRNNYEDAYCALWKVLLKNGEIVEALHAAEQGRAQGLIDLIKLQYGLTMQPSVSFQPVEAISSMLEKISTQTVFIALEGRTINFWVLNKEQKVHFRQKEVEAGCTNADASDYLQELKKNYFEENKIGRGTLKCEDRSLDDDDDDAPQHEEHTSDSSHCEGNSLRHLHALVVGPIKELLQGEELIIVPDGPLGLAPFAAFVDPADSRYLSESIRIRILPSLTTIKLIAESPESFHETSGALLVGDPCFKEITKRRKPILPQLPYAREEVMMIGEILNTTPLTGAEATKDEVQKLITSVSLVHIATHGDAKSGDLALTPNPGRTSKMPKKEDYMLTMEDVQAVRLRAKLVVLSCCHSGKGKVAAEGVVGIARAFIGAGARSVLVSLWAIDDEATMEFMRSFYLHLRDGESASVALNQAMECLRNSERFSAVKYWAPFVLIGDDVTFQFGELKE